MHVLEQQKPLLDVIERAWSDRIFKDRLKANPKLVLAEAGMHVPENVEIVVSERHEGNVDLTENSEETFYLTLPAYPSPSEASEAEIDALGVSPGAGSDVRDGCSQHPCCPYTKKD